MATIDELKGQLDEYAPPEGLPRGDSADGLIERWFEDGAAAIHARRRKTTRKEQTITLVAGQYLYDLEAEGHRIMEVRTERRLGHDEFPSEVDPFNQGSPFSSLANGQRATQSLQLMRAQSRKILAREREKGGTEIVGDQLRIKFDFSDGDTIVVVYEEDDRDAETVPDRHIEALLTYARLQANEWYIDHYGSGSAYSEEGAYQFNTLQAMSRRLEKKWMEALGAIGPEFD